MNTTNQNKIVLAALSRASYRGVSACQLRNRGIASPSGVICHLRNEGYFINTKRTTRSNGKTRYVFEHLDRSSL